MKKTLWLLACFGIFYACSCKKEPLPFQNSFSCKINGIDWKPEGGTNAAGGIKIPTIDVGKYYYNAISIDALKQVRDSKTGDDLIFEGITFRIFLELDRNQILNGKTFYQYGMNNNGCSGYYSDSIVSNFVKVLALDTLQQIVKGQFEFETVSPTCGRNLKITEGKFEVRY